MCSPHRWVIQSQDPILRVCNNKCIDQILGEKSISWLKIYIGFFSGLTTGNQRLYMSGIMGKAAHPPQSWHTASAPRSLKGGGAVKNSGPLASGALHIRTFLAQVP